MDAEILDCLRRIERSVAILVRAQLRPVLEKELSDKRMSDLWRLTGIATQRDVKKKLKMSANTISATWQRWERLGLLVKDGKEYRRAL
jgi:Mn-dependent DtxR family transcriptional regulator